MKLQTKFILTLLSATLLAFIGAQVFQQILGGNALNNLSRENLGLLEQREQLNAENIYRTIDPIVQMTIALGEMPKLDVLIGAYSNVDGLLEYSIYSNKGMAAYSTSREIVKSRKTLPPDLKNQLLGDPAKFARRTGDAFEIYKPMVVTAKCLECHDDFKMGAIGGVAFLRLSADALAKSKQSWTVATTKIQNTDVKVATYTTLVIALVFSVLTWWTVKRLITVPIGKIITSLKRGAEQLNSSSTEITSTSQTLAEGASEQAASLEETSASLEEISSMTQRNAQNVASAKEFTAQTRATAESGAQSTHEMGEAMNGIRSASGEMRDAMNGIKSASNDVSKIIKTIDEIAFQTNILALNAAVEAARAGEAGMGFAVVADEVRNLAQRSAKAAKETADMIETSIKRSDDGVRVTDKVVASVEEVAAKSQQLEQKLAEIVAKAQKVDEQVTQIASASQEQSQGISEVNAAVGQMDKVTQSNAANAEESAAAATELNAQAEALQDAVHELEKLVGGSASEPAAPQTKSPAPSGFRPNTSTFKSRSKPVVARTPAAHKPASAPSNSDFPMPEAGSDALKSGGFKDF